MLKKCQQVSWTIIYGNHKNDLTSNQPDGPHSTGATVDVYLIGEHDEAIHPNE